MSKKVLMVSLMILAVVSCSPASQAQEEPQLLFEAVLNVNGNQEFHVSLGVQNAGDGTFAGDENFDGQMKLYDAAGALRASAQVIPLRELSPGETAWPLDWHTRLEPGPYELTWGAEGYGTTTIPFTVVERDGRLYLGKDAPPPSPDKEAFIARAIEDLSRRTGVDAGEISLQGVEPTEFPDASLGVPEPGQVYAQVVVPGYVIRLAAGRRLYQYHAGDGRVVPVPSEDNQPTQPTKPSTQPTPITQPNTPVTYRPVELPALGLTFEVPDGWERLEPAYLWTPEPGGQLRLGVNEMVLQPPAEPEAAMLPDQAQIIRSEPVNLGWAEGRCFVLERYGPADSGDVRAPVTSVQTHVLLTVERAGQRRGIDFYASAPTAEQLAALTPHLQHLLDTATLVAETPDPTAGWQTFVDDAHGLQFKYPPDWTYRELETKGAGPEDWPLARHVIFFPQAWAGRFEQSGPPDPNAPPAVAPLQLEIYIGPLEQYRRACPEPTAKEALSINGIQAVREVQVLNDQIQLSRYLFPDPDDAQLRVVLVDMINGFPERVAGNEAVAQVVPLIVQTFKFAQ